MKKIILFSSIFFAGLVSAQETTDIKKTIEKANAGDVNAQLTLGILSFSENISLEESYKKAAYWYNKAAEQGNPVAQYNIGAFYYKGLGVKQSDSKAFYWWKKAAEQGNPDAQISMGFSYYGGKGIEQSNSKAFYWWEKAAKQGNPDAQVRLGN